MTIKKEIRVPRQERSTETRNKILTAGKKLFSERGFYKTNSKQIAKEAGVATGTFYMYFKDKKPLFLEIFLSYYNEITEKVLQLPLSGLTTIEEGKQMINDLVDQLFVAHNIAPGFHREMITMIYSDPDVKQINDIEEDKVIGLLSNYLKLHKNILRVDDYDAAAQLVQKSAEEIIHSIRIFGGKLDENRMLTQLKDMICRYLFLD
ncbi:TetR/AcrR family transcriptional regulator [bacterium]|nr:TetR/AcrR family transcriptional regulator [bacterium]